MTRTALWLIGVFALIAAACVAFGAYFSSVTLVNAYRSAVESRFAVTAERLAGVVERAASLGIALPAQATLAGVLEREARIEPSLRSIDLVDERGVVVFSSDAGRIGASFERAPASTVRRTARNDLDAPIGQVVMRYDPQVLDAGGAALRADLWQVTWPALIGACCATIVVGLLLAMSLRRAARRAADPAHWPVAARSALAEADAAHAFLDDGTTDGGGTARKDGR
ncbi:hypothetical protein [Xanthobacter agilis]|uniref:Two-component sensor histidine kinase n=1 Tax=Xanthobacter agilis TaxID=47492 RepID=A0ABU0LGL5_XANAG|nr:hypothetical protein [Xanthobacter agilis]MDQ0506287.1 hypothetical protein [Xanthobacter agilis]